MAPRSEADTRRVNSVVLEQEPLVLSWVHCEHLTLKCVVLNDGKLIDVVSNSLRDRSIDWTILWLYWRGAT